LYAPAEFSSLLVVVPSQKLLTTPKLLEQQQKGWWDWFLFLEQNADVHYKRMWFFSHKKP
jgi:hypothetical protein